MADTFTALLRLVLQETGGNQNVWGDINNASAIDLLEDAIAARLDLDVTPATDPVTLTADNGAADQSRNMIIALTGVPGGTRDIIVPSTSKLYIISNETADEMTIKTVANAGVIVRPGTRVAVIVDPVADDVFSVGDVPSATETVEGIAEIATQAEVDAGTDDERIVTPLKLANTTGLPQATETTLGAVELATQAEVDLGTDPDRVITPATYEGRKSSETLSGHVELATQAEVDAGTDTERAVTPATLSATPTGVYRGCKAHRTTSFTPGTSPGAPRPLFDGADNELAVALNAETIDTDTIHDNAVNNSRLVVPTGVTKIILRGGIQILGDTSAGIRHLRIWKNGAVGGVQPGQGSWQPHTIVTPQGTGARYGWEIESGVIDCVATDFYELYVLQQAGSGNVVANTAWFEMEIIT